MTLARAHWAWDAGGEARLVALDGDAAAILSSVSSPPGSRPTGKLLEAPGAAVRMKVHVCRAQEDGSFRIEGRLLDATKALRERLLGYVAPGAVG